MQTPIDFGKAFLNRLFFEGNIDAAADAAAEDLLWTGDDRSLHIRTRQELEKMLELLAVRIREPHYVDIAAIKSQLCPDNTVLVTYELSLVPENVSRTLVLFCSMFIAPADETYRITFLHFSEKTEDDRNRIRQISVFADKIACGIMILAAGGGHTPVILYYNRYITDRLGYEPEEFEALAAGDPFFAAAPAEKEKFAGISSVTADTARNITLNTELVRRDGNHLSFHISATPAYRQEERVLYYCVLHETTGFRLVTSQLQSRLDVNTRALHCLPGAVCGLHWNGETGRVFYMSKQIRSYFGISEAAFADRIGNDPLAFLEMTDIRRERLVRDHLHQPLSDPDCGMYRIPRPDGSSLWVSLTMIHDVRRDTGEDDIYLCYMDRNKDHEDQVRQEEKSRKLIQIREQQAREEIEAARRACRMEVARAKEQADRREEGIRRTMQRHLDAQKREARHREERQNARYQQLEERTSRELRKMTEENDGLRKRVKELEERLRVRQEETEKKIAALTAEQEEKARAREERLTAGFEEELERSRRIIRDLRREKEDSEAGARLEKARENADKIRHMEKDKGMERVRYLMEQPAEAFGVSGTVRRVDSGELRDRVIQDFMEMIRASQGNVPDQVFRAEEAVRNVMLYQSLRCNDRRISLTLRKGAVFAGEVDGSKAGLQTALCNLLDSVLAQTENGGRVTVTYTTERPAKGEVGLMLRILGGSREAGLRDLVTAWDQESAAGDPLNAGIYNAGRILSSMDGSMRFRNTGADRGEYTVKVRMKLPDTGNKEKKTAQG